MSLGARSWLPAEAMDSAPVRALVAEAAGRWSSKWFARADPSVGAFEARRSGTERRSGGWRVGAAVATAQTPAESVRLAASALGAELERLVLSETERDIVTRFAGEIAADLAATIERALGLDPVAPGEILQSPDPFEGAGGLRFCIADRTGRSMLDVAIPSFALAAFRKAAIRAPRRRNAPLVPLAGAVDEGPVRVVARLGAVILPLGELAGLAAGDVLVLDRAIEDGAELAFSPRGRPFARGAIQAGGGEFSLLLTSSQGEI